VGALAIRGEDGQLRVGDADVHVKGEGGLAAGELAKPLVQHLVAGAVGHLRLLAAREWVRAGYDRAQPEPRKLVSQGRPEGGELADRRPASDVDPRGELQRAGVRLGAHGIGPAPCSTPEAGRLSGARAPSRRGPGA
jgi:hypothetical protein